MQNFDLTPLYRSAVGFDRLNTMLDTVSRIDGNQSSYPPYNIERTSEDEYRISVAVAGFKEAELSLEIEDDQLTLCGKKVASTQRQEFLHQGIAKRNFFRKFQLADHIKVVSAELEDGLLNIDLKRETPEALKPRQVPIGKPSVNENR